MKTLVLAVVAAVGTIASPAFAAFDRYGNYYDSRTYYDSRDAYRRGDAARVISSQPVYAAADTREECWNPREGRYQDRNESHDSNRVAGTALGAIAGGVIGHQIGDNNAGTVAGAILGGIAGNQIQRHVQDDRNDLDLSTCRTVANGPDTLQGYDVTYEYRGQQYTTRMASAPDRFLRLGSDIRDDGLPYDNAVAYAPGTYNANPPYTYNNNPYGGGG
jgi:uncharacterized protein YcfJ